MKTINLPFVFTALLFVAGGCEKDDVRQAQHYTFVKAYCAQVTVGGFVGVAEKCFRIGDVVVGHKNTREVITIRIAEHSPINDGPADNASYQELLDVPVDYLVPVP